MEQNPVETQVITINMSNVLVKTRVRRCEEVVFKLDTSEESWDWLFLASAAISGLYYIANPSDHSTTTQHLFRNPPFVLTLSGSSNKIHWWIAKNIHLIMSYESAAWNVITDFWERDGSTENGTWRTGLRRLVDVWSWSRMTVGALSVSIRRNDFYQPEPADIALLLRSSSKAAAARPDATSHHWLTDGCLLANGLICCIVGNIFFFKNKLSRDVFLPLSRLSSDVFDTRFDLSLKQSYNKCTSMMSMWAKQVHTHAANQVSLSTFCFQRV